MTFTDSNESAPSTSDQLTTLKKTHARKESSGHLCTACDQCYRCKVRCSGEKPTCERCQTTGSPCTYSTGKPLGKPKGSKNKIQRRKTAPQLPRASVEKDLLPSPSTCKRQNDDDEAYLPQPKRTMSSGPSTVFASELHMTFNNTPDMPSLQPTPGSVTEPLSYYGNQEHGLSSGMLEHPVNLPFDDAFPSAEISLETDDFKWFTAQPEQFIASTPVPILDVSIHQDPVVGDSTSYIALATSQTEQSPTVQLQRYNASDPLGTKGLLQSSCLCDPLGLGIISELHTLQLNLSPLDTALLLARRGLSTVSSYLSCPACSKRFANSPSLFLACVLILQQVFACYITLRMQGARMLASRKRADSPLSTGICIGEFEVEGDESCNALLDAIVRTEIERGKGVMGTLEQFAEKAGEGKERMASVLLQSLRDEIGGVS